MMDAAWAKFIAAKNKAKPGDGDRIAAEVEAQGWSQTAVKKWGVYPYVKPFGTPTGKLNSFPSISRRSTKTKALQAAALGGIAGIYAA